MLIRIHAAGPVAPPVGANPHGGVFGSDDFYHHRALVLLARGEEFFPVRIYLENI